MGVFKKDLCVWSSVFLIGNPTSKIGKNPDIIVGKLFTDKKVWTLNTDSKVGKKIPTFFLKSRPKLKWNNFFVNYVISINER